MAKSKSSATIGLGGANNDEEDDDEGDSLLTPFTSRFGSELARSRSSHLLKDQNSPSSSSTSRQDVSEQDENLSSWAKYLKNKYGGRGAATGAAAVSRADREQEKEDRRARLGLSSSSTSSGAAGRSDYDQSKNAKGSLAPTPQQPSAGSQGGLGSQPKTQYLQKQAVVLKFGSRGSQPGFFSKLNIFPILPFQLR